MIDREKVIKGLELCRYDPDPEMPLKSEVSCDICPYWDDTYGCRMNDMFDDAIALLKAQEPVKPQEHDYVIYGVKYTCGACHHKIWRNNNFCPNCGRKVEWE